MKTRKWKLDHIRIYGGKYGEIWMPCAGASKQFDEKFSFENRPFYYMVEDLRDALLHITNDGDFRLCEIVWAVMECHYIGPDNRQMIIKRELQRVGYNVDCFADEKTLEQYEDLRAVIDN